VFDNLYFVGHNSVSAWAIRTSDGIVVIDSLNNADEARTYIVDGLTALGLDPATISHVVLSHAHGDHINGARYLQDTYGAEVVASTVDWQAIDAMRAENPSRVPAPGLAVEDGQQLTVGDLTLTFHVTPGHTAGALSMIFDTTDGGQSHVVGMFGGLGTPGSVEGKRDHIASLVRFRDVAEAAGVDALIANHQTQDRSLEYLELLRMRRAGDPNPYVIGREGFLRYLDIQRECTYYAMAREGQYQ